MLSKGSAAPILCGNGNAPLPNESVLCFESVAKRSTCVQNVTPGSVAAVAPGVMADREMPCPTCVLLTYYATVVKIIYVRACRVQKVEHKS